MISVKNINIINNNLKIYQKQMGQKKAKPKPKMDIMDVILELKMSAK